jgi:hypothetical protein
MAVHSLGYGSTASSYVASATTRGRQRSSVAKTDRRNLHPTPRLVRPRKPVYRSIEQLAVIHRPAETAICGSHRLPVGSESVPGRMYQDRAVRGHVLWVVAQAPGPARLQGLRG